jgi:hypothetical protein
MSDDRYHWKPGIRLPARPTAAADGPSVGPERLSASGGHRALDEKVVIDSRGKSETATPKGESGRSGEDKVSVPSETDRPTCARVHA